MPNDDDDEDTSSVGAALCCAGVRRPQALTTAREQRMHEARLRFLRGTVEVYHQLVRG